MPDPSIPPTPVIVVPLSHLDKCVVDPAELRATEPCHFRLVDVSAFLDSDILQVVEFPPILASQDQATSLSSELLPAFAAISYPWRDLQGIHGVHVPSFSVAGATHADPIAISVLRTACLCARAYDCEYLWLDRVCILQESRADKSWQIQRMFCVYEHCAVCLVFPGGLVRLAHLDEETCWIDRAWTLQEAVAPRRGTVKVVFALSHPTYCDYIRERCEAEGYGQRVCALLNADIRFSSPHGRFVDQVIELGHSATSDLDALQNEVSADLKGLRILQPSFPNLASRVPIRILRGSESLALGIALKLRGFRLWTAAYTRTSSRPVDMVLSIMGLFGVYLDSSKFGKNKRTRATIALIQELMQRPGATATWLYIAPAMHPDRGLSTLPLIPETSVDGRAYIVAPSGLKMRAVDAQNLSEQGSWDARGAPKGDMTDSGYFVFWSKAAMIVNTSTKRNISNRSAFSGAYDNREIWAVIIGRFKTLNRDPDTWKLQPHPKEAVLTGLFELTLMLVEKHGFDLYHRVGMEKEIDERKTEGWNWTYRQFKVGGPGRGERRRCRISPSGPSVANVFDAEPS